MLGEFKNFIQIIKTWVTDKIVSYSIYALIILLVGKQFIELNSFSDIECILANFRQKRTYLFFMICILFFIFPVRLGY